MADRTVGSLPRAVDLYDDSLLAVEQQGEAMSLEGAQLKGYARQGVADYVEAAQKAAQAALEAVKRVGDSVEQAQAAQSAAQAAQKGAETAQKAVEDLEVSAVTLPAGQPASVEKTARDGHVWLKLGLPRGERGLQGETGKTGSQGDPGQTGPRGKDFTIKGYFDTLAELESEVPEPEEGAAYGVGTAAPYDIHVWDALHRRWVSNGNLQGAKGDPGDKGDPGSQGLPGAEGKSAYQYALEGGYTGTEASFRELLGLVGGIAAQLDAINGEVI